MVTEITKDMIGKKISCTIEGKTVEEALITWDNSRYFLLQNVKEGLSADDKKGYLYSWSVKNGSSYMIKDNKVRNIILLEPIVASYELW